jgi:hypothetical protein
VDERISTSFVIFNYNLLEFHKYVSVNGISRTNRFKNVCVCISTSSELWEKVDIKLNSTNSSSP